MRTILVTGASSGRPWPVTFVNFFAAETPVQAWGETAPANVERSNHRFLSQVIPGTVGSFFDNSLLPVGRGRSFRKTATTIEDKHPQGTPSLRASRRAKDQERPASSFPPGKFSTVPLSCLYSRGVAAGDPVSGVERTRRETLRTTRQVVRPGRRVSSGLW